MVEVHHITIGCAVVGRVIDRGWRFDAFVDEATHLGAFGDIESATVAVAIHGYQARGEMHMAEAIMFGGLDAVAQPWPPPGVSESQES